MDTQMLLKIDHDELYRMKRIKETLYRLSVRRLKLQREEQKLIDEYNQLAQLTKRGKL